MRSNGASSRPKLPLFMTLRGGLTELVDAVISKLDGELLTGQNVTALEFTANNSPAYQVQFANGQTRQAQAVIMATPAFVTANLLKPHSDLLAEKLRAIRYISTATVSLAFKRDEVSHPLNGFGFVVPKSEPCQLMACTWISTKFDHRAPADQVLLRVFVGGYKHQELVDLSDEALVDLVRRELNKIMGLEAQPTRQEIYRWPQGNAQYDVGHLDRIAEIEGLAREALPGLYLTGSAFKGVGLPDCIHQGEQTAQQVIQYLLEIGVQR
jgi:oxygen-dependent protoporphyrinogen oxidase